MTRHELRNVTGIPKLRSLAPKSLPAHDQIHAFTRMLELLSLAAAFSLLTLNFIRALLWPGFWAWWILPVFLCGVLTADLLSGIVHWGADTWGKESMPVLGRRFLRPFRVHHINPDDFLRRDFIDCNGDVAMLNIPFLCLALGIDHSLESARMKFVFLLAFSAAAVTTNQLHQWAHMTNPPHLVGWLQRARLILSFEQHQRHHSAPYVLNYCIITGWCNRPLSSFSFFCVLETLITRITRLKPRCDEQVFIAQVVGDSSDPVEFEVSEG